MKQLPGIERLWLTGHHTGRPCVHVGHRPDRHDAVALLAFALAEMLGQELEAHLEVHCLAERPGQVGVSGLAIACALILAWSYWIRRIQQSLANLMNTQS